jgi:hypothetical protein
METLRFNLCGLKVDPRGTLKKSGFNLEQLFIEELINTVPYLLNYSVPWSASHVPSKCRQQIRPKHSELCLPMASADMLTGHSDATKRISPVAHMWFMLRFSVSAWKPSPGN